MEIFFFWQELDLRSCDTEERHTEARLLGFSYDFGVTVIRHQNTDAMVLASALMRGIHPLMIFKIADVQGGGECFS